MKLIELVKNYRNSSPLKIIIVSPFVSEGFVKTTVEEFLPSKMLVVADKRSELVIDKIKDIVEVRLAERLNGLVHAKLFLFDWENGAKIFVWGSANATRSAFGKNAECISSYKIRNNDNEPKSKIESYFEQMWKNAPAKIESCQTELDSIQLFLPEFSLIKQQDSFDKWLEEGKLFNPDDNKTTLTESVKTVDLNIRLKKDIATKQLAEDHGFDYKETKTLSCHNFEGVPDVGLPSIKDYAVNTVYGYWMPNQIYIWFREEPKSEIRNIMENKIGALIKYIETEKRNLIKIFMDNLNNFVKTLINNCLEKDEIKKTLGEYFQKEYLSEIGDELDTVFIETKLEGQLDEHIKKCRDLQNQRLKIHDLFPIRFSPKQWDKFSLSFINSAREASSKSNAHGLGKIFIEQTQIGKISSNQKQLFPEKMDVDELFLEQLRKKNWNRYRKAINDCMKKELDKKLLKEKMNDSPDAQQSLFP